ncbi:MAG TPA: alpha/beta fold hydrolase [Chloroflexota bacterium]|nr:alpha/beta fold hydrolase [Chloroflexota bacterium]
MDRPRTLDEAKQFLLDRLRSRRSPMALVDPAKAESAITSLRSLDGQAWGDTWGQIGAEYESLAEAAEAKNDAKAAAEARFQAYAFYSVGRYPCPNHPRKLENYHRGRENYVRAGAHFDPPLMRVAIPFEGRDGEGNEVVAYVRKPSNVVKPPVIALWGGIDGWKEETYENAQEFLKLGFATVSVDMPGVGESPVLGSADGERQFTPLFEWIRAQPDLDGSRIGCLGSSFGGYWASKLAHTHREYVKAVVSWGGCAHYTFQPEWFTSRRYPDSYLMDLIETRARMLGGSTYDDYAANIGKLSLLDQGVLDEPNAPLLLVNGKDDQQSTIEDLYLLLQHGGPKDARVYPGGHMGHTPETRPTIVSWLSERLSAPSA